MQHTTGRYLVLFRDNSLDAGIDLLKNTAGLSIQLADTASLTKKHLASIGTGVVFDTLGVAVVNAEVEQLRKLNVTGAISNPIIAVEPERYVYALWRPPVTPSIDDAKQLTLGRNAFDYFRGFAAAVNHLTGATAELPLRQGLDSTASDVSSIFTDNDDETWGLQATNVPQCKYAGNGVAIAMLDTGLDLKHPDFVARRVIAESFIPEESDVQDSFGHGTHTTGTACGPNRPLIRPRYGIAYGADLCIGKVLNNTEGKGTDTEIIHGIKWAVSQKCAIISMSLGTPVTQGQAYSVIYEGIAKRALQQGILLIAAAGNDSKRSSKDVKPVAHPANCPSIMAVAAIDNKLQVANFSNGGINTNGGQIDICGPGVDVRSSLPVDKGEYGRETGTSMATPHVAGIAALIAESDSHLRGSALWARLTQTALRLQLSSSDVGSGLVQAPRA